MKRDQTTEERILEAAKKVFLAKGMSGARMQDIADEAGINKAMLHYYFRSKDVLFEMIFKEMAEKFMPRIIDIIDADDKSLFEVITLFCERYIDSIRQMPYVPIFILHEINRQPQKLVKKLFGARKPPIDKFFRLIEKEVQQGTIRPIHPVQLMWNILSTCVFPFVAKPMFELVAGLTPAQFDQLMEQRKKELPVFIIQGIRK